MTDKQIKRLRNMRDNGISYGKIAEVLGVSKSTIKSYSQRNGMGGYHKSEEKKDLHICRNCGMIVPQTPGRKEKMYCDNKCRNEFWSKHHELMNAKAIYHFTCIQCGKPFEAYGNNHRHYCSRECFFTARYGNREISAEMSG